MTMETTQTDDGGALAARWILEILDLPRESAVTFGTSASACGSMAALFTST